LSNEEHVDRKPWIAGIIFLVLVVLCISGGSLALNEWKSRQGQVGHREPLPGFTYCSSEQARPCILSFNLHPGGGMVIHILVNARLPNFYMKIKREEGEQFYECKKASRYSTQAACTGETMPVGETLSFLIISAEDHTTLAEGSFPIIGMAFATPEIYATPTPIPPIERPPRWPVR